MTGSLDIRVALSRPFVPAHQYLEEPLFALLDIIPDNVPEQAERSPLNLVLVVDASATMHNFQLTDEEREMWQTLAISRDEMERGEADERNAIYWSGQTLADMRASVRTPMGLAVDAIKNLLSGIQTTDKVTVFAFADRVHTVFSAADWVNFPDQCLTQLDNLREQRLPVDIGTGTFMAEALRLAGDAVQQNTMAHGINRLLIISDGIVQDSDATLMTVATIQEMNIAITTLGVGDEFDEEFLVRVADNSRGDYYYAATSEDISKRLNEELATLQTVAVTDMHIAVRGDEGTLIQDMAIVRPTMLLFDEIYTEDGWMRARIGDISSSTPLGILVQIAPAAQLAGVHPIGEVQLTWAIPGKAHEGMAKLVLEADFSDDPLQLGNKNEEVAAIVDRFTIYKFEREAQRAQERGDLETAREKLGAATRELRKIGENGLANDMEGQIEALTGTTQDAARAKRIKATTRRLGSVPTPINEIASQ